MLYFILVIISLELLGRKKENEANNEEGCCLQIGKAAKTTSVVSRLTFLKKRLMCVRVFLIFKFLFKIRISLKRNVCGKWGICNNTLRCIFPNNVWLRFCLYYEVKQNGINCYLKMILDMKYIWNHRQGFLRGWNWHSFHYFIYFYVLILIFWFHSCHKG